MHTNKSLLLSALLMFTTATQANVSCYQKVQQKALAAYEAALDYTLETTFDYAFYYSDFTTQEFRDFIKNNPKIFLKNFTIGAASTFVTLTALNNGIATYKNKCHQPLLLKVSNALYATIIGALYSTKKQYDAFYEEQCQDYL